MVETEGRSGCEEWRLCASGGMGGLAVDGGGGAIHADEVVARLRCGLIGVMREALGEWRGELSKDDEARLDGLSPLFSSFGVLWSVGDNE
jgi:hypothetical protein